MEEDKDDIEEVVEDTERIREDVQEIVETEERPLGN